MKPCFFHAEAEREYIEALLFLDNETPGLGLYFLAEFEESINLVSTFPDTWALIFSDIRRFMLSKFPYSIVYRINGNAIEIIAVMHHHRKPFYWQTRIQE